MLYMTLVMRMGNENLLPCCFILGLGLPSMANTTAIMYRMNGHEILHSVTPISIRSREPTNSTIGQSMSSAILDMDSKNKHKGDFL